MLEGEIETFNRLRQQAAPLSTRVAPAISSYAFRLPHRNGQPARRWDSHFSTESRSRSGTSFKASGSHDQSQDLISLGVGRPLAANMPWVSLTMGVKHPMANAVEQTATSADRTRISGEEANSATGTTPSELTCRINEAGYDFGVALNYGYAAGSPQLLRFVTEHVQMIHNPAYDDWETCLTCGSTAAIEMILRMFCNRGDCVLVEEHTYPNMLEAIRPLGVSVLPIRMDELGIMPQDLEATLASFSSIGSPKSKPKLLYMIPTGQNPTGTTQSAERRREVYRVAEDHDLIIIEDDPYYLLQLGLRQDESAKLTPDAFLAKLPPSYLSLDTSGRVIRLDSTSKILAPGLRCGWLTACSQVVEKFLRHSEFSTVSPSGPSQVMLFKLLDQHWGHIGFTRWLMTLSTEYSQCLAIMNESCERHFVSEGLCRWRLPTAGMFLWIGLDWTRHATYVDDNSTAKAASAFFALEQRIYDAAQAHGVQVSKGSWFDVGKVVRREMPFRLTFAAASASSLASAIERFAQAVEVVFSQ